MSWVVDFQSVSGLFELLSLVDTTAADGSTTGAGMDGLFDAKNRWPPKISTPAKISENAKAAATSLLIGGYRKTPRLSADLGRQRGPKLLASSATTSGSCVVVGCCTCAKHCSSNSWTSSADANRSSSDLACNLPTIDSSHSGMFGLISRIERGCVSVM